MLGSSPALWLLELTISQRRKRLEWEVREGPHGCLDAAPLRFVALARSLRHRLLRGAVIS